MSCRWRLRPSPPRIITQGPSKRGSWVYGSLSSGPSQSPTSELCKAVRLSVGLVLWLALNIEVISLGSLKPGGSR